MPVRRHLNIETGPNYQAGASSGLNPVVKAQERLQMTNPLSAKSKFIPLVYIIQHTEYKPQLMFSRQCWLTKSTLKIRDH